MLLVCLFLGCQTSPFGPRFVAEPYSEPASLPEEVEFVDVRPAWQRRYWQGAVTPRDYELAITVIPLEKFAPADASPTGSANSRPAGFAPLFRTPDQQGFAHSRTQFLQALQVGCQQLGLESAHARLTLDSCVVVVNKSRALQGVWDQTAEARREALAHWRRGLPLRMTLGVSSGFSPGLGPAGMGAGAQFGPPQDVPPLPGELPLSRAYGPVRGPPPELGDYGPDVTCEIRARVELTTSNAPPREVSLQIITRSLPLEPPNFLSDEAVSATFAAALRQFPDELATAWLGENSASADRKGVPTEDEPVASEAPIVPQETSPQGDFGPGSSGGKTTSAGSTSSDDSGSDSSLESDPVSSAGAGGTTGSPVSPTGPTATLAS